MTVAPTCLRKQLREEMGGGTGAETGLSGISLVADVRLAPRGRPSQKHMIPGRSRRSRKLTICRGNQEASSAGFWDALAR
jgi:hypothetical protein